MPGKGMRFFSSPERPGQSWNSIDLRFNVYWGSIQVVKRPGREADHLHLMQRLMNVIMPPIAPMSSWCGQRTNFFLLTTPMKTEQCSETSVYKIQTPGNNPNRGMKKSATFISRLQWFPPAAHTIVHLNVCACVYTCIRTSLLQFSLANLGFICSAVHPLPALNVLYCNIMECGGGG